MALAKRETEPAEAAAGVARAASLHDAKLAFERRLLQLRLAEARGTSRRRRGPWTWTAASSPG